jgi:hypothetical protein
LTGPILAWLDVQEFHFEWQNNATSHQPMVFMDSFLAFRTEQIDRAASLLPPMIWLGAIVIVIVAAFALFLLFAFVTVVRKH